ncbi:MAG TPA: AAA family ATPase [Bifidobacterium sp.]|nr:AAA family ATPase [Bifidobacterium sp.]
MPTAAKSSTLSAEDIARARNIGSQIRSRFAQTLVGQDELRESLITTLVAGGHILIESVPGLAKTTAAQTLATSVSGSFKRVQCTPDLMPSDLIGTQVFDFATQKFSTQIGPIHANFVLLDEINRSNAKTQSAMLEAMAEGATTIGGQRIALPKPFMVIATQNPIDQLGTYRLPEAQMDRFLIKTAIGHPGHAASLDILRQAGITDRAATVAPVLDASDVLRMQGVGGTVHMDDAVLEYIVRLVEGTRHDERIRIGASTRGALALARCARVWAASDNRGYVVPDDVKELAEPVLAHRITLTPEATFSGETQRQAIRRLLDQVPAPTIGAGLQGG